MAFERLARIAVEEALDSGSEEQLYSALKIRAFIEQLIDNGYQQPSEELINDPKIREAKFPSSDLKWDSEKGIISYNNRFVSLGEKTIVLFNLFFTNRGCIVTDEQVQNAPYLDGKAPLHPTQLMNEVVRRVRQIGVQVSFKRVRKQGFVLNVEKEK